MKARSVIRIAAEVALIVLLSSCSRETPIIKLASAVAAEPLAVQWPAPVVNEKGDSAFTAYEYY